MPPGYNRPNKWVNERPTKKRTDNSDATYAYRGYGSPGVEENGLGWVLERIKKSNGDIDWATRGSNQHKWTERGGYTYTP